MKPSLTKKIISAPRVDLSSKSAASFDRLLNTPFFKNKALQISSLKNHLMTKKDEILIRQISIYNQFLSQRYSKNTLLFHQALYFAVAEEIGHWITSENLNTELLSSRKEIDGIKKNENKITIDDTSLTKGSIQQLEKKIKRLEKQMYKAAKNLDFIDAAKLRDEINLIKQSIVKQ